MQTTLLTINELAALLRMHPVTVRRRIATKEYPTHRFGGRVLFTEDDVAAIIAAAARPAIDTSRARRA